MKIEVARRRQASVRVLAAAMGLLGSFLQTSTGAGVIDVPRMEGIVIDGKPGDWRDAGFKVEVMTAADGWVRGAADLDSRLALGWDDRGLLVLAQIMDQDFAENANTNELYAGDSVELYLIDKRGGTEMIQAVIAPGMTAAQVEPRCRLYDYRKNPALKARAPAISVARTRVRGGYVLEALLPWTNVGISARPGVEAAVQIFVNDTDAGARPLTLAWHPATGTFMNTQRANQIRLAEKASPALPGVTHAFNLGSNYWFSIEILAGIAAERRQGRRPQVAAFRPAARRGRARQDAAALPGLGRLSAGRQAGHIHHRCPGLSERHLLVGGPVG